jgi:hypothetical protein
MRFITSAAVLRAVIFGKEPESFIQSQSKLNNGFISLSSVRLGNIAPALGTTNAVISGIQVLCLISHLKNTNALKSSEVMEFVIIFKVDRSGLMKTEVFR